MGGLAGAGGLLRSAEPLVESTDMHRVSGLETWFSLPGRTAPAPPKWKMFLVSATVFYLLNLIADAGLRMGAGQLAATAAHRADLGAGDGHRHLAGDAEGGPAAAKLALRPAPPLTAAAAPVDALVPAHPR